MAKVYQTGVPAPRKKKFTIGKMSLMQDGQQDDSGNKSDKVISPQAGIKLGREGFKTQNPGSRA